jgi:hypothetical protein
MKNGDNENFKLHDKNQLVQLYFFIVFVSLSCLLNVFKKDVLTSLKVSIPFITACICI